jgi:DNA (cytosine-5)-methyltransferase 1
VAAYYNENDPKTAAWLRELIKAGLIADGEVDTRSIADVQASDLAGFVQCHFFAGIGGWSYALRLAGWDDARPVWTGSCPCQPFSSAGAQAGGHDPRDLWPVWFELVRQCRPVIVFGEQVEAAIRHGWLDRLCDDLEAEDYAIGAVGLPGPSVGAFDIRQRLWFVAESDSEQQDRSRRPRRGRREPADDSRCGCWDRQAFHRTVGMYPGEVCVNAGRVADIKSGGFGIDRGASGSAGHADLRSQVGALDDSKRRGTGRSAGSEGRAECSTSRGRQDEGRRELQAFNAGAHAIDLGHADEPGREARNGLAIGVEARSGKPTCSGFWRDADWLACVDGKSRPVEPGTFPLAYGVPARVGRLRGYGNAIKPQVAQAFIEAYLDVRRGDERGR